MTEVDESRLQRSILDTSEFLGVLRAAASVAMEAARRRENTNKVAKEQVLGEHTRRVWYSESRRPGRFPDVLRQESIFFRMYESLFSGQIKRFSKSKTDDKHNSRSPYQVDAGSLK